ncbi:AsmA-like C-terminal region-containing protein [Telmatobacter sp. DSM 110680]|uniref:AsmA-like C-terminal region-containing protein n=1 Tax=Telmatobacter sp. DSM 110680 TaxID=3036704 RepID=A0AAU7DIK6_9BACT
MAHPSISAPPPDTTSHPRRGRIRREVRSIWQEAPLWVHVAIVAAGALLAVAAVFISANWPYRHRKIAPMLEDVLASQVTFTGYHRTYFPHPGFVATGITMRRKSAPDLPPLGHVDTMVVAGTWSDLLMLRQRVELVDITGLHIVVPPIGSEANHRDFPPGSGSDFDGPDTMIARFMVHKSLLEIQRKEGKPLSFPIKQLEIRNLHRGEALTYAVEMQNALPNGHILAHGSMGPIHGKNFLSTPVSGNYAFTQVNLHDVGDISGTLDARGVFKGTLEAMEVEADTITQDFAVTNGRPTPVEGIMRATLYGEHGDLDIHSIDLKIRETNIHAVGSIKGDPKLTNFDITLEHGRAEDVMQPFVHDEVPIAGSVWLKGHAYVGPPGDGFIERLRMTGTLNVPAEKVTDKQAEKNLSAFSERAKGDKKPNTGVDSNNKSTDATKDVLSSLEGSTKLENGVVSTSRLTFKVPGAQATMAGTFKFHGEVAHLTGNLRMDTDISHTATGLKSFLLKPLAPFFKKKNAGAVVPIAVTGTPGHYQVTQDITHNK